jgi:2-haloacid dehalogenase
MNLPLVLFDVNGTLSDMGRMTQHFEEIGAPPELSAHWFAAILRDGFALSATGGNPRFVEVAEGALRAVLAGHLLNRDVDDAVAHVLEALQALPAHDDVADGLRALVSAGYEVAALTNGARTTAEALLERARVREGVGAVLSVEDAPGWKPTPESYAYALDVLRREAGDVVLVAAHPWDLHGAARAGLRTVWVNRSGAPYPAVMTPPDHEVATLTQLADVLAS